MFAGKSSSRAARTVMAVGLVCAYAASSAVSARLSLQGFGGAALWTSTGFLAGGLILMRGPWRVAVALACFASQLAVSIAIGVAPPVAAFFTVVNQLEAGLAAVIALRHCAIRSRRLSLRRLAMLLLYAAIPAALSGSLIAAVGAAVMLHQPFLRTWISIGITNGLGLAVVLPAVLMSARFSQYRDFRRSRLETLCLLAAVAVATAAEFYQTTLPLFFAVFPLTTYIAFRLGPPGAAVAGFLVGVVAVPLTLNGHGPSMLAASLDLAGRLRLTQTFVAAVLFTGVATAGALAEQARLRRLLNWRDRAARRAQSRARLAERADVARRGGGGLVRQEARGDGASDLGLRRGAQ